jgi:hypothetical protein
MMTHATAAGSPDPLAAAIDIAERARRKADRADVATGTAAIAALATGITLALIAIAGMAMSPAAIPMWCAAHGGCP